MRVRIFFWTLNIFLLKFINAQCDSNFTYFPELPSNVTILVGDTCLNNNDIIVLDSLGSVLSDTLSGTGNLLLEE